MTIRNMKQFEQLVNMSSEYVSMLGKYTDELKPLMQREEFSHNVRLSRYCAGNLRQLYFYGVASDEDGKYASLCTMAAVMGNWMRLHILGTYRALPDNSKFKQELTRSDAYKYFKAAN